MKTMIQYLSMVLFITTFSNAQWVKTSLDSIDVSSLTVSGTNLFAGTYGDGVFLSTNNGTSWTAVSSGLPKGVGIFWDTTYYHWVRTLVVMGTNLFAGTYQEGNGGGSSGGIFLTTNNGASWVNTGMINTGVRSLAVSGTNLFAGTDDGAFLSTNTGDRWMSVNNGLTNKTINALVASGTNLFAGTDDGVFLSTNTGDSWTSVNNGLTNKTINALVASGANLFAMTWSNVFLSTNNGISWNSVSHDFPNTSLLGLIVTGTNVFIGLDGGGIYQSTNNGSSWSDVCTFQAGRIRTFAICGEYIFAAGCDGCGKDYIDYMGVWRRPISEMISSVDQSSPKLPENYSLSQNFPNPFNPSTTLRYSLPERSTVRLSIFNTLGQKISEMVNETKDAGSNEQSFNASQLSSGIYFYRIEATSVNNSKIFVETKKMVLLR